MSSEATAQGQARGAKSPTRARGLRADRWLWGLCGGLIVAVAWLFCVSGWGMGITARGRGPGAWVFYGTWGLCILASLGLSSTQARLGMGGMAALGWWGASLGSMIRAQDAMRWHPVVLGMNLGLFVLGLASAYLVVSYALTLRGSRSR